MDTVNHVSLKDLLVDRLLPQVQTPAQYIGGEWNAVVKDHRTVRGTLCLAFPDLYSIGMSHYGLQVLYDVMNRRADWACERAFAPMADMERLLREHGLPLFGLESFTPLSKYDVLGFTLQYDLCYSNVLTMLDLGGIPLDAAERTLEHPLVIAGGPCAVNPEPMSKFVDLFVVGDGEEALPAVCDLWLELRGERKVKAQDELPSPPVPLPTTNPLGRCPGEGRESPSPLAPLPKGEGTLMPPSPPAPLPLAGEGRFEILAKMAARLPYVFVPRFYRPAEDRSVRPIRDDVPAEIVPAVVEDLNDYPPPQAPIVPYIECVQDRICIEIMRGCPGKCRFCQSTTIKRPLRFRTVESIVQTALEQYRTTGYNEISLLSLSTSDYPQFHDLMKRLQGVFRPLGVAVSLPSLRINEQLQLVGDLMNTDRHSGLTLAPEAARDDMRRRIGKPITNENLLAGCRTAFENGFSRVKLYFMCGLPEEREEDLDGIIELSETIARLGREVRGRPIDVVINVSNFVPKPQTPFQWNAMQTHEYFAWARNYLYEKKRMRSIQLKCHDIEGSLLEGVMCRGDRQVGEAIELAWRRGARLDGWSEHFRPEIWWQALSDVGIDIEKTLHLPCPAPSALPWDQIGIYQGRGHLERECQRAGE